MGAIDKWIDLLIVRFIAFKKSETLEIKQYDWKKYTQTHTHTQTQTHTHTCTHNKYIYICDEYCDIDLTLDYISLLSLCSPHQNPAQHTQANMALAMVWVLQPQYRSTICQFLCGLMCAFVFDVHIKRSISHFVIITSCLQMFTQTGTLPASALQSAYASGPMKHVHKLYFDKYTLLHVWNTCSRICFTLYDDVLLCCCFFFLSVCSQVQQTKRLHAFHVTFTFNERTPLHFYWTHYLLSTL